MYRLELTPYTKMLPKRSDQAETSVRYTNNPLRAISASRLFANDIPEKVIQERTGHHSLVGLCAYERTTKDQKHTAAKVLSSMMGHGKSEENKDDFEDSKGKKDCANGVFDQLETVFLISIANDGPIICLLLIFVSVL